MEADGPCNPSTCKTSLITFLNCCQPLNIPPVPGYFIILLESLLHQFGLPDPSVPDTFRPFAGCTTRGFGFRLFEYYHDDNSVLGNKLSAMFMGDEILLWLLSLLIFCFANRAFARGSEVL